MQVSQNNTNEYEKWLNQVISSAIEKKAAEIFELVKNDLIEKLEKEKTEIIAGSVLHVSQMMRVQDGERETHIVISK